MSILFGPVLPAQFEHVAEEAAEGGVLPAEVDLGVGEQPPGQLQLDVLVSQQGLVICGQLLGSVAAMVVVFISRQFGEIFQVVVT